VEKEEKKKRMLEYFQQLQDEVLEEEAALLKEAEGSQVAGVMEQSDINNFYSLFLLFF